MCMSAWSALTFEGEPTGSSGNQHASVSDYLDLCRIQNLTANPLKIKPAINQVELNFFNPQPELLKVGASCTYLQAAFHQCLFSTCRASGRKKTDSCLKPILLWEATSKLERPWKFQRYNTNHDDSYAGAKALFTIFRSRKLQKSCTLPLHKSSSRGMFKEVYVTQF